MGRGHQCLRSKEEDEPKSRRHQSLMLRWVAHSHTSFFFAEQFLSKRKKCMLGIFSVSLLAPILSMKVFTYRNYLLFFSRVLQCSVFLLFLCRPFSFSDCQNTLLYRRQLITTTAAAALQTLCLTLEQFKQSRHWTSRQDSVCFRPPL